MSLPKHFEDIISNWIAKNNYFSQRDIQPYDVKKIIENSIQKKTSSIRVNHNCMSSLRDSDNSLLYFITYPLEIDHNTDMMERIKNNIGELKKSYTNADIPINIPSSIHGKLSSKLKGLSWLLVNIFVSS